MLPALAILTAVPLYRAYQFPLVDPGFLPDEACRPITPEERATLDLYRQAGAEVVGLQQLPEPKQEEGGNAAEEPRHKQLYPPGNWERAFVAANPEPLALLMKATRGTLTSSAAAPDGSLGIRDLMDFPRLLIGSATKLEQEGRLDESLETYLATIRFSLQFRHFGLLVAVYPDLVESGVYDHLRSWATRPGQTPERILAAARRIEQLVTNVPPDTDWIKLEYVRIHAFLTGDLSALKGSWFNSQTPIPPFTTFWLSLPWERTRALRLLNLLTRRQLDELSVAESEARGGKAILQAPSPEGGWRLEPSYVLQDAIDLPPLFYRPDFILLGTGSVSAYTAMETYRRVTVLTLALDAWKLKHGSLPKRLDDLVGPCLKRLPVDPVLGRAVPLLSSGLEHSVAMALSCATRQLGTW